MEKRILPLDGPLPPYVQMIGSDGLKGTWCSSCVLSEFKQEVFGFSSLVPIGDLKALGIRIDLARLMRHNRPVAVVLWESPEQSCRICDHGQTHHRAMA